MEKKLILVDTSILIDFFRKTDKSNSQLIKLVRDNSAYCISVVTEFEIYTGTSASQTQYWEEFLFRTKVLAFDKEVARVAVAISKVLKQNNKQIGMADLFIAATGVYHNLPLATLNSKHFQRIDGLELLV
ncbi:type II toxin-antitoxin system VapC family toxin [Dyadobacter sp. MSC1_007]|jgi:tRNA(fMet)-specific endonuclease VapC|uniref:type II toxin-antitoxin system VapC family toxin n=1 Tax=Dyadobacter sp. MSC1_007 TaxID=2909264 RepID=UPI00202FD136|nr:type II toxin-antitoxin system VapC family toxin [Dyadobacter sp. MSC1_007]